ncbi:MAG: hypothetical protein OEZ06_04145 [Myxococcales bacterium]|nr:hypothetical protein [Myxococcales bacterium]
MQISASGTTRCALALISLALIVTACGDDDDGSGGGGNGPTGPGGRGALEDSTGQACVVPGDCYPDVDHADLSGSAICLDRVRDGYCTHLCGSDSDCCAVEGECQNDLRHVCSPFESTDVMQCFLSCEDVDLRAPADDPDAPNDEQSFCQREANTDFICRSSGGGRENRKICVPGDCGVGAHCWDDADCDPDLECLTDYHGGYCGRADCTGNADCPQNSVCADLGNRNVCVKTCTDGWECTFCRHRDAWVDCRNDVELVEASGVSVCVPE